VSPAEKEKAVPHPLTQSLSQIQLVKGIVYEEGVRGLLLDPANFIITDPLKSEPWYNTHFFGKDHFNFIGTDGPNDVFLVSVISNDAPDVVKEKDKTPYRVIIRTKKRDEKRLAVVKGSFSNKKKPPIKEIMQSLSGVSPKKMHRIKDANIVNDLKAFEDRQLIRNYKFGLLYCAEGQTDEEQMFSNLAGSADWEEFLNVLGDRVDLLSWPHYRAGLDVKTGTTGKQSVHTRYRSYEVMFHVSTLLPHDPLNPQQLERKRHLGNDIVVIVFKEGNQLYDPNCIKSEFNHIFVVVSKVNKPDDPTTYYKVNIACKEGVPPFQPDIPEPPLIPKHLFKDFLLCKLINGENTSYEAPAFKMKIQRTRLTLLKDIQGKIKK